MRNAVAAVAMLVAAPFCDGVARDGMRGVHPSSRRRAPERYAKTVLRALGGLD